jgi:hypothetical protein
MSESQELERALEVRCLDWLNRQPSTFAWKNTSTGVFSIARNAYMKKSKYDLNGVSDILGWTMISGVHRSFAFEIKLPTTINKDTETTRRQHVFLKKAKSLGVIAAMVCSLEDMQREFDAGITL